MMETHELHALADGELSAERTAEWKQRLEKDTALRAEFESILALKQIVSSRSTQFDCSDEWKACSRRLRELDRARRPERVVTRYSWALCGLFFLFILFGGIANRGLSGNRIASEDIMHAAANLIPTRTPPSRDVQAQNAYLDALLGEASRSLAPNRLEVRGGAVGTINGHRAVRLTLRDAVGEAALIVVSDRLSFKGMSHQPAGGTEFRLGQADDINMVAWHFDRGSAVLIGERSHEDLVGMAQRISLQ